MRRRWPFPHFTLDQIDEAVLADDNISIALTEVILKATELARAALSLPAPDGGSAAAAAPLPDATQEPAASEDRASVLEMALRDLVELCSYAKFDNGVTSPDGRSEADFWASDALDYAQTLLLQCADHHDFPTPTSALAHRLKYRLDVLIERAGTEEAAITSRGIGISYLFARELYKAIALKQEGASEVKGLASSRANTPLPAPDAGWRDMTSAPKDAVILVADEDGDVHKVSWGDCCPGYPNSPRMRWCVSWTHGEHGHHTIEHPTHWLPLPAPPVGDGK